VIGFRVTSVKKCFIMKMVKETTLSLSNITSGIQHFTLADRTALGTSLNLLCSDIPIYWAE
ncbi:unnamed protein product, partial [Natator depressus]